MKLETYHYQETSGWHFSEIQARRINLFVGETGSGKSRLLNTISSVGEFVGSGNTFKAGGWKMQFSDEGRIYSWKCESKDDPKTGQLVDSESLSISEGQSSKEIYSRKGPDFIYEGNKLPRLSPNTSGLYLFREEPLVAPLQAWFTHILRRNFHGEDLVQAVAYQTVPANIELITPETKVPVGSLVLPLPLSVRLHLLKRFRPQVFFDVINLYRDVFPNVESCDVVDASELKVKIPVPDNGNLPIFIVKEKHVKDPVLLQELSSGMQKVLLIMTDVLTLPKNGTYLVDEYENSLGVNAISFLPEILLTYSSDSQFFITSHHPYLINNLPVEDWQIFHRRGANVTIKSGKDFTEKFGASKQQAFTKLLNERFYTSGVE